VAKEKTCVGIDIGSSAVKVCQLRPNKRSFELIAFGAEPLPPETVVDGALMSSGRVVEAIQKLIAAHKIKNKRAAIAISGHSVIIKKIPLPQMTREELEQSIQWEAEQFIPFDMADVFIDAQILSEESESAGQMDVVLVAAKKDYVNEYTSVISEAGLDPVVCDVDAFAVESCFEVNYDVPADQTLVLVNIGAAKTNINILAGGITCFTRDLAIGGSNFTEELQKQLNVSFEEAEARKTSGNPAADTHRALQAVADNVVNEVHRSIDFYAATSAAPPPAKLYLSGGTARLAILAKSLEARIHVPVEVLDPFRQIDISGHDGAALSAAAPAAVVAVGLALRHPGDFA
jgi:type IV pilus assembly protein PilM